MHLVSAGICVQKAWKMSGDGCISSLPKYVWLVALGRMGNALANVMAAHLVRLFSVALRNNNSAPCAISSSHPAHLDSC